MGWLNRGCGRAEPKGFAGVPPMGSGAPETLRVSTHGAVGVERGAPLLVRCRVSCTSDMQALEHTTTDYRADRCEYKIRLTRH